MSDLKHPELPPLTSPDRHMLTAQHVWLEENGLLPHITCALEHPQLDISEHARQEPKIAVYDPWFGAVAEVARPSVTLNVSYAATRGLKFGETALEFEARFNGHVAYCVVPYSAIMSIAGRGDPRTLHMFPRRAFAKLDDDRVGMYSDDVWFGLNTEAADPAPRLEKPVAPRSRAHLSVVK